MSKLVIQDLRFELEFARLEAFIDDGDGPLANYRFVWGVVIEAKTKEVGGASWTPSFTSDRLLETKPKEVASWQALAGRCGAWEDEDEHGLLYTFSHEAVINVTWKFERAESGRLVFSMDGKSRFAHPGGYVGLLPVQVEAELDFAPIPMGRVKEASCRKRLAQFGIQDTFEFMKNEGVSYLVPTNYPGP